MKITDNKFLVFLHVLDHMILNAPTLERVHEIERVKGEFETLFASEVRVARNKEEPSQEKALEFVRSELYAAKQKHPDFPRRGQYGVCIIAEELGELAQVLNNYEQENNLMKKIHLLENARTEAAHVAVTAVRFLEEFV